MTLTTIIRYQVEQFVGDKWLATWTQIVDGVTTPLLFDTDLEAQTEMFAHIQEVFDETGESVASYFRLSPVEVYDPAPLYPVGFQFQMRVEGMPGLTNMILTYRYHNGEEWRYHLGLDLGAVGTPVPAPFQRTPLGTINGRQYIDFTTIDEYQVASQRIPAASEPPVYVITRGYGVLQEYWSPQLGWVNRAFAYAYGKDEVQGVARALNEPKCRWEEIR